MSNDTFTLTDGIPAVQVGRRLMERRRDRGLSARDAATAAGLRRQDLRAFELGKAPVPDPVLHELAEAYGVEPHELLPVRGPSPVAVSERSISVGPATRELPEAATTDEVLERYLSAVSELRGRLPGDLTGLRDADVALLSDVLGDTTDEIEDRLMRLIACTRAEARAIRQALVKRRLLVPAAGLLLGVGTVAPAAAGSNDGAPDTSSTVAETKAAVVRLIESSSARDVQSAVRTAGDSTPAPEPEPVVQEVAPEPEVAPQPSGEDWAEIGDPMVAVRTGDEEEDWAELIPPLVVERDDAGAE